MSMLHKPFWQDLGGKPVTGSKPVTLVMQSGRMTPQRHTEIQQIYMRFSMAKLTGVGDFFVFNRVLTDGTRVRMESMQGQDRVFVWASDSEQTGDQWEYGWAFIPVDKDSPETGYVRKLGTGQGGLNRDSFQKHKTTDGTKNFTFVDGKTGKRSVSDGRMGGERIWRGPKNKSEVLTYDTEYVYYKGARISTHVKGEKYNLSINGAAIAKGADAYWIVIISNNWLAAMRLPKVGTNKEIKGQFVDCGEALPPSTYPVASIWNFAPDGLNAVCVGAATDQTTVLHKIKLTAVMDLVPFTVTHETDTSYRKPQRVVSNEFKPEEAERIFRWYGWKDFSFRYNRKYFAVYQHFVGGAFGPTVSNRNDAVPGYTFESISNELDSGGTIRLSNSMFLYDDGDLPPEGLVIDENNRRRFSIADKLISELDIQYTYVPIPGVEGPGGGWESAKIKNDYLGAIVTYDIYDASSPRFDTVAEVVSYCESKWNYPLLVKSSTFRNMLFMRMNGNQNTGTGNNYPGTKMDYKNLTEAAEYIRGQSGFILKGDVSWNGGVEQVAFSFASESGVLNFLNRNIEVITEEERQAIEDNKGNGVVYGQRVLIESFQWVRSDGEVFTAWLSENHLGPVFGSTPYFLLWGNLNGSPNYTNNYKIQWKFKSEIGIEGSRILAAGYDKDGKLSVLHIAAEPNQKIAYTSEIVANDEEHPKRKTIFSGGYTCKLKLNDTVIDEIRFAVNDSFEGVLSDGNTDWLGRYIPQSGLSPRIDSNNINVWDVDEYLGHVLYRKFESTASASGEVSEERKTQYSISFFDYLYTPSKKYTLGEKQSYSSSQRALTVGYSTFFNTADAMWRFAYGLGVSNKTEVNGVPFFTSDTDYEFGERLYELVPEDQKNPRENFYGWDDRRYNPHWVRGGMLLFSGVSGDPYTHPSPIVHDWSVDVKPLSMFGIFEAPPASRMTLRSYSDDAWMVCICEERNTKEINNDKTTAGFFIKTGKNSPIKKIDAATDFPFLLSDSPKLLRPTFYIGLKK